MLKYADLVKQFRGIMDKPKEVIMATNVPGTVPTASIVSGVLTHTGYTTGPAVGSYYANYPAAVYITSTSISTGMGVGGVIYGGAYVNTPLGIQWQNQAVFGQPGTAPYPAQPMVLGTDSNLYEVTVKPGRYEFSEEEMKLAEKIMEECDASRAP